MELRAEDGHLFLISFHPWGYSVSYFVTYLHFYSHIISYFLLLKFWEVRLGVLRCFL